MAVGTFYISENCYIFVAQSETGAARHSANSRPGNPAPAARIQTHGSRNEKNSFAPLRLRASLVVRSGQESPDRRHVLRFIPRHGSAGNGDYAATDRSRFDRHVAPRGFQFPGRTARRRAHVLQPAVQRQRDPADRLARGENRRQLALRPVAQLYDRRLARVGAPHGIQPVLRPKRRHARLAVETVRRHAGRCGARSAP